MTSSIKYVGMDVHKESISLAVRNAAGKIVMEYVIETKANTILQFVWRCRCNGSPVVLIEPKVEVPTTAYVVCVPDILQTYCFRRNLCQGTNFPTAQRTT